MEVETLGVVHFFLNEVEESGSDPVILDHPRDPQKVVF